MSDGNAFTFYFHHGWALNSLFWSPLKQELKNISPQECSYNFLERGYFSEYPDIKVKNSTLPKVVICHSLGLHLLPKTLLNADFFILLGCFSSFHPEERIKRTRSQKIIRRMLSKLLTDAESVIFDFHNLCFNSTSDTESQNLSGDIINELECWNIALLRKDLSMLDSNEFDTSSLNPHAGVLILQGEKDMVVSREKSLELNKKLPGSKLEYMTGGSHGFALQSPVEAAKAINNFLTSSHKNTVIKNPVLDTCTNSSLEIR